MKTFYSMKYSIEAEINNDDEPMINVSLKKEWVPSLHVNLKQGIRLKMKELQLRLKMFDALSAEGKRAYHREWNELIDEYLKMNKILYNK